MNPAALLSGATLNAGGHVPWLSHPQFDLSSVPKQQERQFLLGLVPRIGAEGDGISRVEDIGHSLIPFVRELSLRLFAGLRSPVGERGT
jgi:hypothetical protein